MKDDCLFLVYNTPAGFWSCLSRAILGEIPIIKEKPCPFHFKKTWKNTLISLSA